jgi:ribosomal protein S18 acetylase RimI-like enzyme
MHFTSAPAANYPLPDLVRLLNRGFEDYFVPIQFSTTTFSNMLRRDSIDLTDSRVLSVDRQPSGIALIARRASLGASRLAAMGIAKEARGKGAGSWLMDELIRDARQRGDQEMVLEVIEQNEPAVRLYRSCGFETVRRLIGLICTDAGGDTKSSLYELDLREMGELILQHALPDLPWQLSGESIAQMTPPARAYRKGQAYIVLSNPELEHIVIWSLLVEQEARGRGLGSEMLKNVIANHAAKTWHVPALLPEELGKVFERAGFARENLSQWQMRLVL